MPGKKVGEYSWRWMSSMKLLRTVAASDTYSQAALDSMAESIEHYDNLDAAYDNALALACICPATVTSASIDVYIDTRAVDGAGTPITTNRWCWLKSVTITKATVLMLEGIPAGTIKVQVTGLAGTGSVQVCWSKSS